MLFVVYFLFGLFCLCVVGQLLPQKEIFEIRLPTKTNKPDPFLKERRIGEIMFGGHVVGFRFPTEPEKPDNNPFLAGLREQAKTQTGPFSHKKGQK